jgi:hypothetical protein
MARQRRDHRSVPATADLVAELRSGGSDIVRLGQIAQKLDGRANGVFLLVLALPEMIPMVGLSAILATPILVIGAYMLVDGNTNRLPKWIDQRRIKRSRIETAVDRSLPLLRKLHRISRPRWPRLACAVRLHGLLCMLLAVVLAIPIPGINTLAASGVAGIGIGTVQRDGVVIAAALLAGVLAIAAAAAVLTGAANLIF